MWLPEALDVVKPIPLLGVISESPKTIASKLLWGPENPAVFPRRWGQLNEFAKNWWANFCCHTFPLRHRKFESPVKVVHLFMLVEPKSVNKIPHTVIRMPKIKKNLNDKGFIVHQPKRHGPGDSCVRDLATQKCHHKDLGKPYPWEMQSSASASWTHMMFSVANNGSGPYPN